ncbi:FKBP-type peptidyl-prolyl cis-trans isomerase [Sinomonas sp. ASV322]|uniref:FKBP-type peptidyl-prolyl cis-trans isomerase n=1 Tax=Sinomonas sp. ASV322 TaxID=3041920 RepID=UPI0027DB77A7|nr:FKBP-type peptidyl-prolyl cis-trans isomerase [Sinomonas sp. ASV322]MDQ4501028.1 FKBP-type peptidyl-prolyl cis-trans isomerase [Sinomonas sp. ASV322]
MRRFLALVLPLALLIAGCSSGGSNGPTSQSAGDVNAFSSLKVTPGDKAPTVDFAKPLSVSTPTIKVVQEGSGAAVKAGQSVVVSVLALKGTDGSTLGDSFSSGQPQKVPVDDSLKQGNSVLYNAFVGAKIGSYLAYATPPASADKGGDNATTLLIVKITDAKDIPAPLKKPEGDPVTPPAGLPAVTEDSKGVPQIDVKGVAKPAQLVSQDLIKGKGATVQATDTIVANYVGVNLSDGTKFDSSYDRGTPATFGLGQVIEGWTKGLTGKTVGSRVLLVIPAAQAYGDQGQGQAKGDLVFVVDILGVQ